jgi:uncharacterized membrane protein (UPF0127 family)
MWCGLACRPMCWGDLLGALVLAAVLPVSAFAADCAPDHVDLRDGDSTVRFQVEVRDSEAERAEGLMNRESLPRFSGMLFVYDRPQPVAFWMRNTLIPLDMLFFDGEGRLTTVKSGALPHDETPVAGGDGIQYVLEINGGMAEELGIEPGAELRHPALTGAAWACAQ